MAKKAAKHRAKPKGSAKKTTAKRTPVKATAKGKSQKAAKYEQPGAPWWKQFRPTLKTGS